MEWNLLGLLNDSTAPRIAVLGDIILDRYTWGQAERVSPEAPVVVLRAEEEEVRLGGAASVALLLRSLGAQVRLAGVVGEDASGRIIARLLDEASLSDAQILRIQDRTTTTKERFLGRAGSRSAVQILRVDREVCHPVKAATQEELVGSIRRSLEEVQVLLISDYAKGVCTPNVLARVIAAAKERGVPIFVDPARITEYQHYRNATLLIPNRREAEQATGRAIDSTDDALLAANQLCEQAAVEGVLVKLDSEGMVLLRQGASGETFPTRPREVRDVTGAGDMVLAMVGFCRAAGAGWEETVRLANVAAGLEVERVGVAPVTWEEIQAELSRIDGKGHGKLLSAERLEVLVEAYRRDGRRLVFTNGCFDLLHIGHVTYLQSAAGLGDVLVVGVNSDRSVRRLKGSTRPIIGQNERAALLAALGCVDHVVIFDDDTPEELLRRIRPDVLVKGGTYTVAEVVGRELVESYGGEVQVIGKVDGVSTTNILATVQAGRANGKAAV